MRKYKFNNTMARKVVFVSLLTMAVCNRAMADEGQVQGDNKNLGLNSSMTNQSAEDLTPYHLSVAQEDVVTDEESVNDNSTSESVDEDTVPVPEEDTSDYGEPFDS